MLSAEEDFNETIIKEILSTPIYMQFMRQSLFDKTKNKKSSSQKCVLCETLHKERCRAHFHPGSAEALKVFL